MQVLSLNFVSYLISIGITLGLGFWVFMENPKKKINRYFFIFIIGILGWLVSLFIFYNIYIPEWHLLIGRFNFAIVILFLFFALEFVFVFPPENFLIRKWQHYLLAMETMAMFLITFFTPLIDQNETVSGISRITTYGSLYYLYIANFILIVTLIIWILIKKIILSSREDKTKIYYIIFGFIFSAIFGFLTNILIPLLGYQSSADLGTFSILFVVCAFSYAIIKHRLFDIKAIATELLVFIIWIVLFINTFLSFGTREFLINIVTLISVMVIGAFLIRGVISEVGQKDKLGDAAEKLYAQNFELAIKNKTLSLLEKLYETSISTLLPAEMAERITSVIRQDLNLEFVGILVFNGENNELDALAFSETERLKEALYVSGFSFADIKIKNASQNPFFGQTISNQSDNVKDNFDDVLSMLFGQGNFKAIEKDSHIITVLLQPLILNKETFGVLISGFNRDYNALNAFEKASMQSYINVVALLINKAYLDKYMKDSYEVEKRAHAIEKKANDELKELDVVKNQFLMTIQHHLRTPLTSMRGYAELLLGGTFGKVPKKIEDVVKRFDVSTTGLIKMVNDFLDVTQFQMGKGVVSIKEGVNLSSILNDVLADIKLEADKKGVSLALEKPHQDCIIDADESKLRAAIVNVFDNSVKYTQKGSVEMSLNVSEGKAKIKIKDTGMGISQERLPKLFNSALERTEESKKAFVTGRGIGLYLAGQIVAGHNGKIWAESAGEGKGSTFHIELPLKQEIKSQTPKI